MYTNKSLQKGYMKYAWLSFFVKFSFNSVCFEEEEKTASNEKFIIDSNSRFCIWIFKWYEKELE